MRTSSLAGLAAGGAVAYAAPSVAAVSASARSLLSISAAVDEPAAVALTFDDGPHPAGTPAVLERLAGHSARASFFLVGEQVERRPELVAEIVAAGHEVALHGHTHRGHLRLKPRALRDDLQRGVATVAEAAGRAPRLHRPPFGRYSAVSLAMVRRSGLEPLLWSRHGRDWTAAASPGSITERLSAGLSAGEVLLLHDADHYAAPGSWRRTADALPWLLEAIEEAGLEAVAA